MNAGVSYTRDLNRLLLKSLFGCGVVCGLQVKAQRTCNERKLQITVPKGLALDCMGNAIEVPDTQTIEFDPECEKFPPEIWVILCYWEKPCRPKDVSCSAEEDGQSQPTAGALRFPDRVVQGRAGVRLPMPHGRRTAAGRDRRQRMLR